MQEQKQIVEHQQQTLTEKSRKLERQETELALVKGQLQELVAEVRRLQMAGVNTQH